jgi:ArsR family transcriptional regulator
MMPHDREEYVQAMGHVWQGFEAARLEGWMAEAGLGAFRYVPLPPDPAARGPGLFAASARKSSPAGPSPAA